MAETIRANIPGADVPSPAVEASSSKAEPIRGEADRIFRAIFGKPIPPVLAEWFDRAPEDIFPPLTEAMRANYRRIMTEAGDLEALEVASRVAGCNLLLRLKFQLMIHLAECVPELRSWYVNRSDCNRFWVLMRLKGHIVRSVWKLLKGLVMLIRWHGP